MSQKRKHDEVADLEASDPASTKKPRSFPHAGKTRHKRPNAAKDKDSEYGASANALKNRIRDLKRLLAHVDNVPKHKMSASSRIERERELEACEHELEEKTMKARESEYRKKMIGKYHQVRFFGRCPDIHVMGEAYTDSCRPTKSHPRSQASQEGACGSRRRGGKERIAEEATQCRGRRQLRHIVSPHEAIFLTIPQVEEDLEERRNRRQRRSQEQTRRS